MLMRLEPGDTDAALFIKLVAPERTAGLAEAESVAHWLQDRHASVAAGRQCGMLPDGRVLWVYPYLAGRAPRADAADMVRIGAGLGQLHRSLAKHPHRQRWRARTNRHLARLISVRQALAQGNLQAGPMPERLAALARDPAISFAPEAHAGTRTPLHGDLNLFNLLMVGSSCVFLDLEEVPHSVLPPAFDLATVFERVVLVDPGCARPVELLDELLRAYHEASGTDVAAAWIAPALRGLALRAMCTLATSDPEGADDSEWRKFFFLMDLCATALR
jgi:Ser/Thr protein kinase RdoA (MazF antagonist)